MSLRIWLPLTGNLNNNGLSDATITNNGATVASDGKLGSCYSFDGDISYISLISTDFPTILNGNFSICFWVYNNDTGGRSIFFGNYGLTGSYFNIEKTTGEKLRFYWSSHPDFYTAVLSLPTSAWSHITVTRTGDIVKFYLNGELKDTSTTAITGAIPLSATIFYLGRDSRTGTTAFNGKLNDFRLYDHVLSIKEIKELTKGLVAHYPLTGNIGTYNLAKGANTDSINTNKFRYSQQNGGSTCTIEYDGGVPCLKITRNDTEYSGWCYFSYQNLLSTEIKESTTYTVSFDIISSGSGNISFNGFLNGNATNYLTNSTTVVQGSFNSTSWSHIVLRAVTKDSFEGITIGAQQVYMGCPYMNATEVWIMMKNMKVEEGIVDTPWNPNPADSLYSTYNGDDGQVIDISGYNHNCQFYQSTTDIVSDSPRYLTSYRFAGDLTKICYCNTTDFNFTDNFTWAVWIKPEFNSEAGSQYIFTVGRADYGGFGYGLRMVSSTRINIKFGSINGAANGWNVDINENEWVHIAFIKSGNELTIYKNGILNTTVTFSGNVPSYSDGNGLGIGCFYYSGGRIYPYYGKISDFRVYATALSADDIKELYNKPISISNHGSLFTQGEFIENNGNNFGKNGLVKFNGAPNPNLMPNSYIMQLGTANPSTGTWRLAGSTSMTKERVLIENGMYGFQNVGVQTPNDGSCYGMDKFPLKANTDYTISMNARIVEGNEGYAGFNIYNATYGNGSHTKIDKNYYVTPLSKEWTRCWLNFHTDSNTSRNIYIGITTGESSVTTQMCLVKIEEGLVPTAWNSEQTDDIYTSNLGFIENKDICKINKLEYIQSNEFIEI